MNKVEVHQLLHGYSDGHRQVAGSFSLKPRDAKTVLVLSDMSAHGGRPDEDGYLTGYPLPESGVYALARTWPAPEMPRPGCVWTQTLLIEFPDLATLTSLNQLLSLFRRPEAASYSSYGRPLQLVDKPDLLPFDVHGHLWPASLMKALYEHPRKKVVSIRPENQNVDHVLVNIWAQQWPRLRRNFRFCTFSAGDRSIESHSFDVQLIPSHSRSVRSSFSNAVDVESIRLTPEPWLGAALDDLDWPDVRGLRSYFRVVGADIGAGREAFTVLCRLHALTEEFMVSASAIEDAVELVQEALPKEPARGIRRSLVSAIAYRMDQFSPSVLEFVRDNWDGINSEIWETQGVGLFLALWRDDPAAVMRLMARFSNPTQHVFEEKLLQELTPDDIVGGLRGDAFTLDFVFQHRRDVWKSPVYWRSDVAEYSQVHLSALDASGDLIDAIGAMIQSSKEGFADLVVRDFNISYVMHALAGIHATISPETLHHWLHAAIQDPNRIAEYLASSNAKQAWLLEVLAHAISPDTVPNDYGDDPWLTACRSATPDFKETNRYLAAFLVVRALGPRSRSVADLLVLGFDSVLVQLELGTLDSTIRDSLEYRLYTPFFFGSSAPERLIKTVANLFVQWDMWPSHFAQLTSRDDVFIELVRCVQQKWAGPAYLQRVADSMQSEPKKWHLRIQILERLQVINH